MGWHLWNFQQGRDCTEGQLALIAALIDFELPDSVWPPVDAHPSLASDDFWESGGGAPGDWCDPSEAGPSQPQQSGVARAPRHGSEHVMGSGGGVEATSHASSAAGEVGDEVDGLSGGGVRAGGNGKGPGGGGGNHKGAGGFNYVEGVLKSFLGPIFLDHDGGAVCHVTWRRGQICCQTNERFAQVCEGEKGMGRTGRQGWV